MYRACFWGTIAHASVPIHGKHSPVFHDGKTIYYGLPNPFEGGRYHSLVVTWEQVPKSLEDPCGPAIAQ